MKAPPPKTFNSTVWQATEHQQDRFITLADLNRQHKVVGMTAPQVYRLLSEPDDDLSKDNWIRYSMENVGKVGLLMPLFDSCSLLCQSFISVNDLSGA